MVNFYNDVIKHSPAYKDFGTCKDLTLIEPGTRLAIVALMNDAKKIGHDLRLLETYRSQSRQLYLFKNHKTQLKTVGCHGYGLAVDFGVFVNNKYAEDNKPYEFLRTLARAHGLISGQDWGHARESSFVDSGHVQRIPVWRQNALFAMSWYPSETYDPYEDSILNAHKDVVKTF